jgi:hypothetical protein
MRPGKTMSFGVRQRSFTPNVASPIHMEESLQEKLMKSLAQIEKYKIDTKFKQSPKKS